MTASAHIFGGWRPDPPDFRDRPFITQLTKTADLPQRVDLRPEMSHIYQQGAINACTGNMVVAAMEYALRTQHQFTSPLSRLYAYWQARHLEHSENSDGGATIRDAVRGAAKAGCCLESIWHYDPEMVLLSPTSGANTNAARHKVSEYQRVGGTRSATALADSLVALANGVPVMFGMMCYESMESKQVAATGYVPVPLVHEVRLGGHAVLLVGYDRVSRMFIVRNSWGRSWGEHGYFYLPFDYVDDRGLSDDFWIIKVMLG